MAQQKLYTEEQVKQMIDRAHGGYFGYNEIMSPFAPIYVPNEEAIEEISKEEILYNDSKRSWWIQGAKYILKIIQIQ